ncbi:DUF5134 domain-containing protein [Streptomyces sp. CA-288835]|uniref:DUF5134 domain-containing protein n=1 Tax=Streptomyces sp. CA-288835 TaxID=3240069 RepID=UPI003D8F8459
MHGPVPALWLLVALCAATGAYGLLRMRSSVEAQRRTAGGEALMGFGMAAMAVPAAALSPPRWAWLAGAVVFGAAALQALWAARADRLHLHHLVGASAMVYMAAVMAGGTHSGPPVLTGTLLAYFTGYVLWTGTRLVPVAVAATEGASRNTRGARTVQLADRPELACACRLSMGIGMLAMLLTM